MKYLFATTSALCLLAGAAAAAAAAEGTLSVYHWFEYMPQALVDKFTAETGIKVTIDTYDSNEAMLASLKAGKLGQYDVAVPADFMVAIMGQSGMLDTFTAAEMTNLGNIAPQWLDVPFDAGRTHSIPYQWGTTSFAEPRCVQGRHRLARHPLQPAGRIEGPHQRARQPERGFDSGVALSGHSAMFDRPCATQGAERHAAGRETQLGQLRF